MAFPTSGGSGGGIWEGPTKATPKRQAYIWASAAQRRGPQCHGADVPAEGELDLSLTAHLLSPAHGGQRQDVESGEEVEMKNKSGQRGKKRISSFIPGFWTQANLLLLCGLNSGGTYIV